MVLGHVAAVGWVARRRKKWNRRQLPTETMVSKKPLIFIFLNKKTAYFINSVKYFGKIVFLILN